MSRPPVHSPDRFGSCSYLSDYFFFFLDTCAEGDRRGVASFSFSCCLRGGDSRGQYQISGAGAMNNSAHLDVYCHQSTFPSVTLSEGIKTMKTWNLKIEIRNDRF